MFETMSEKERREFLNLGKESYKYKGHTFKPMKDIGKQVCSCCGLMALRNEISQWCIKKGCNYSDNPHYKKTLKRMSKQ